MDMRNMRGDMRGMNAMGDGRNPYGSQGGYITTARSARRQARQNRRGGGRRDMAMMPPMQPMYDMRGDMNYNNAYMQNGNFRANQGNDMARGDMAGYDMRGGMDGHHYPHPQAQGSTYYPIQAMGTFEGYYGMPNQDHARQDYARQNMNAYDMRGYDMARGGMIRNDYGYPMGMPFQHYPPYDFGYPVGDFGETLSEKELDEWKHKLMSQLNEQEKKVFAPEMIMQKAKQLGRPMEGFGEKELCLATLMIYTDYKEDMGLNPDLAVRFAYDWLADKDVKVKGAEKLAVYYDEIVEGDKD